MFINYQPETLIFSYLQIFIFSFSQKFTKNFLLFLLYMPQNDQNKTAGDLGSKCNKKKSKGTLG